MGRDATDAAIKLSAKNLWKVYGPAAPRLSEQLDARGNPDALALRLREQGSMPAVADASFDVRLGEIFVIMGLSGSGKSTVLRCLSRLVEPSHGQILLDGEDLLAKSAKQLIEVRRHKMGMVFQNFGLLPHLSVLENITFPLKLQGLKSSARRQRAERVISLVGLDGREDSFPAQLSGGQQQRVGIARSLVMEPDVWLLDEPFSALDPLIRRQMQDEFLRIQTTLRKSIVFVTHDFMEALRIADRMAIMRDGQIVQIGTPRDLVLYPHDDYVAQFTRDVPRIQLLTAGECVQPVACDTAGLPRIPARMNAREMLSILSRNLGGVVVEDGQGSAIGMVTPSSLVSKLAADGDLEQRAG